MNNGQTDYDKQLWRKEDGPGTLSGEVYSSICLEGRGIREVAGGGDSDVDLKGSENEGDRWIRWSHCCKNVKELFRRWRGE